MPTSVQNSGVNPFSGATSFRVMDPEVRTVAEFDELPGIFGVRLQDNPKATTLTVVENITGGASFDEVSSAPNPGQYRPDFVKGTGLLEFNSADNGTEVLVNYEGGGSVDSTQNAQNLGSGDVQGTPPSTANALVRYTDATGLLVKNTGITSPDAPGDNLVIPGSLTLGGETVESGAEKNTVTNIGVTGVGIFKQKSGSDIELKKLAKDAGAGSPVSVVDNPGDNQIDFDIVNNGINNARLAQMATLTIKGNDTGGAANPQDLTVAEVKALLGLDVCTHYFETDRGDDADNMRGLNVGANSALNISFAIPPDFLSIVSVEAIVKVSAGAAQTARNIDLTSNYGGIGESTTTHSETDAAITYDLSGTSGEFFALDISSVFSSLAAGDLCGIELDHNGLGGALDYFFVKLVYNR